MRNLELSHHGAPAAAPPQTRKVPFNYKRPFALVAKTQKCHSISRAPQLDGQSNSTPDPPRPQIRPHTLRAENRKKQRSIKPAHRPRPSNESSVRSVPLWFRLDAPRKVW